MLRGSHYTHYKRMKHLRFLAKMLREGHTLTYYPKQGIWGINLKEKEQ